MLLIDETKRLVGGEIKSRKRYITPATPKTFKYLLMLKKDLL